MIDFSKRWGPVFLTLFVMMILGMIPAQIWITNPATMVIFLAILALVFLIASLISIYYDLKDVYRKHKKANEPSVYEKRGPISL